RSFPGWPEVKQVEAAMHFSEDGAKSRAEPLGQRSRAIPVSGTPWESRAHICAFSKADDEYQVLLPFIQEGLESGEKVVHTGDFWSMPLRSWRSPPSGRARCVRPGSLNCTTGVVLHSQAFLKGLRAGVNLK